MYSFFIGAILLASFQAHAQIANWDCQTNSTYSTTEVVYVKTPVNYLSDYSLHPDDAYGTSLRLEIYSIDDRNNRSAIFSSAAGISLSNNLETIYSTAKNQGASLTYELVVTDIVTDDYMDWGRATLRRTLEKASGEKESLSSIPLYCNRQNLSY